jgi:flavin-binding protein dodecin
MFFQILQGGITMATSVYKIIELVGTSDKSWEDAARNAVETAAKSLKDLRIAEISKLDMQINKGKISTYRARVMVSFKYKSEDKEK